jgi:glycolate oxidase
MTETPPSVITVARSDDGDTHPTGLETLADRLRTELGAQAVVEVTDANPVYQGDAAVAADPGTPYLVVVPDDVPGVQRALRLAHETGTPVVPRGAGSGLSGGAVPIAGGIVLSVEKLTAIREVDPLDEVAVVEAGVITADLDDILHPYGFFYAPDPASVRRSSIGGNVATNAGGLHCAKYGVTRESVLALEVVLPDGHLLRTGHRSIKGVTGLDLTQLLIGSEGTLAVVVAATVRIRPLPVRRTTVVIRTPDAPSAARVVGAISRSPVRPAATELLDAHTLEDIDAGGNAGSPPLADGHSALLLVELDGYGVDEQIADLRHALDTIPSSAGDDVTVGDADRAADAGDGVGAGVEVIEDPVRAEQLWELRRTGRGKDPHAWRLGEDVAVPKSRLPAMFDELERIGRDHGVRVAALSHAGDGNLHPALSLPIPPGADPSRPPVALTDAADDLIRTALSLGGTISGEHGIGLAKHQWIGLELDEPTRALQRRVKNAFDPRGLLNPGKAL